jgi:hypothetical protein
VGETVEAARREEPEQRVEPRPIALRQTRQEEPDEGVGDAALDGAGDERVGDRVECRPAARGHTRLSSDWA